jgi:hypothetical protein
VTRTLFVTDLEYEAHGRDYGAEDIDPTQRPRPRVDLTLSDGSKPRP